MIGLLTNVTLPLSQSKSHTLAEAIILWFLKTEGVLI